jgi:hypothetical protein
MTEQTAAYKVQRQLLAIFDHENVKKDQFFRELIEKDPEHCKIATLESYIRKARQTNL